MRQAFEALRSEVADLKNRHDHHMPPPAPPPVQPAPHANGYGRPRFNAEISVGNLLTIAAMAGTAFIAWGQFTASMTDINNKIANNDRSVNTRVDNVVSDIASRRTFVNSKLDEMASRVEDIPLIRDQLKQQQGSLERVAKNLDDGRGERQRQIDDARERQAGTDKGLALLTQRVEGFERKLDRLLERMEGRREDGSGPFRENRIEIDRRFPYSLRATLTDPPAATLQDDSG
ncbi:hypothetical protein EK403_17745 [Hansschlegelia zhihuaiae]|uniref:Uncharacterized protein n=1 Tax=Hansschlegelia zhihuaiae TaxID=405005 RepID=A0A4Q0MAX9_9HYPH|nr:hypothetical protein EK403_17745 [Hansschlegelia zhihuaiae]